MSTPAIGKALHQLTATEVVGLTRSGALSVVDYAEALLAHIKTREPVIGAWVHLDPDTVLSSARALDALPEAQRGPLHGVAVGVKDIFQTRDAPTKQGSPYEGHHVPPSYDAVAVQVLRGCGALIFGKTTTTQFATSTHGPPTTRNARNQDYGPGGSSSGSAAAVADYHVPIALGTQTGGSVVRPASFNGIYGFKPTWNRVSRDGVKVSSLSCDTVGYFARSADDLELISSVYDLTPDDMPPRDIRSMSLAFTRTDAWERAPAEPATIAAYETAMKRLAAAGAKVTEITLPPGAYGDHRAMYRRVLNPEVQSSLLGDYRAQLASPDVRILMPDIVKDIEEASTVSPKSHCEALTHFDLLRPQMDELIGQYDAVIAPSAADEAPLLNETRWTGNTAFNTLWSVCRLPVINIPGLTGPKGMPVGISVITPRFEDQKALVVAKAVGEVLGKQES